MTQLAKTKPKAIHRVTVARNMIDAISYLIAIATKSQFEGVVKTLEIAKGQLSDEESDDTAQHNRNDDNLLSNRSNNNQSN